MKKNNADAELKKLNKIFKNIDKDKRIVVANLIENAAFMSEELNKLQEVIKEKGCVEQYQNGANQHGRKKSAEVDVYNSMVKNYSTVIKQLLDLLPDNDNEKNELLEFMRGT